MSCLFWVNSIIEFFVCFYFWSKIEKIHPFTWITPSVEYLCFLGYRKKWMTAFFLRLFLGTTPKKQSEKIECCVYRFDYYYYYCCCCLYIDCEGTNIRLMIQMIFFFHRFFDFWFFFLFQCLFVCVHECINVASIVIVTVDNKSQFFFHIRFRFTGSIYVNFWLEPEKNNNKKTNNKSKVIIFFSFILTFGFFCTIHFGFKKY